MMKFTYLCTITATCDVCGKTTTATGRTRVDAMDALTISKWVAQSDRSSRCPGCKGLWTTGRTKLQKETVTK